MVGKGSLRRKPDRRYCSPKQEDENWKRAFGKKSQKAWLSLGPDGMKIEFVSDEDKR